MNSLSSALTAIPASGLTTLAQWRCAVAVAQYDGFAPAAKHLNKSQSTVSHAVNELSQRLGVALFQIEGRKAELTEAGGALLRRAERLLKDAGALEELAATLAKGDEAELNIAVDSVVPSGLVIAALKTFAETAPQTRVSIHETVLSGTHEALIEGKVDFAVAGAYPLDYVTTFLLEVEFIAVAHRDHPLNQIAQPIDYEDLRAHRQLVVRDSGKRDQDAGWLDSEQRWTFSSHSGSLEAMHAGAGFAWIPRHMIEADLERGTLAPLDLKYGGTRHADVSIVHRRDGCIGPCRQALVAALLKAAQAY